jgi:NAD(P)-dependent dehydrogenase (short-subunit alcohol dehydrogenase family)
VEILSALQERLPDAPAVKPEHLGTLRSLQDIVDFLVQDRGETTAEAPSTTPAAPVESGNASAVQRLVVRSVPVQETGLAPALRPGGEVWVVDDATGLAAALVGRLAERGFSARLVGPGTDAATTVPARLDGLVLVGPASGDGDRAIKDAFRLLRAVGPALRQGSGLLASLTRLDGAFGTGNLGADAEPTCGGLAGLVKTARHEWPEVACRALDLDPAPGNPADAAESVVAELLRGGPVEVGLAASGRTTLALHAVPIGDRGEAPLAPGDVVVITGGARGVTAEVAVALATAFRPTLVLLGRSPAPEPEPEWLAALDGEADIKRALAARSDGPATPQRIGEEYRRIAAQRAIVGNLERIAAAGSKAHYRQVDVRDPAAVRAAIEAIRAEFGPVRGLVHGAGVLADRHIEDQTDAQFEAVYDTKVAGLRGLLEALEADELRVLTLFSSSTARFGRTGQVAYAAANEVLNKLAQREARRRPDCRVVSVNWGPWDGGMVTPSLRSVFASEGIGLIPLEAGARYLVEELMGRGDRPVEVVVLGGTTVPEALASGRPGQNDPVGESSRSRGVEDFAPATQAEPEPQPLAVATATPHLATVFERPLELAALPVLRSHVIDGRGVLPLALTLEWLAHGALQRNPGLTLVSVDDLRLLRGAVLHDQAETLAVLVGKAVRDGSFFRVPVELGGVLPGGKTIAHARAEVVLGDRLPAAGEAVEPEAQPAYGRAPRSIYHDVLFHGPELQGLERVETLGATGATAIVRTAPAPSAWVEKPLRQGWLTDPLAVDCAFQLLSLWSFEQAGAPSLPTKVGRYLQFRRSYPAPHAQLVARVARPAEHRALADIDVLDADGSPVARIEGYECVIDASLTPAFRRNRLSTAKTAPGPR